MQFSMVRSVKPFRLRQGFDGRSRDVLLRTSCFEEPSGRTGFV